MLKKFFKNYLGELLSFFLSIFILLVIFYCNHLFSKSIIISDLKTQMYPLIENFRVNLLSGHLTLYSFGFGIGDSIIGVFIYYLNSPMNLLSLVIKDLNLFFVITILLRSAFSGLFCYKYLRYQFKKENKVYFILFSLLYSLSSYFISYNMIVEFLDVYMVFPLVLLGIDKILKEKKHLLYIVSLMFIIASNYYMAYMVCVFSFLYFNYKLIIDEKDFKKILKENGNFLIVSFLICLIMSYIFIPIGLEIKSYVQHDSLFGNEGLKFYFNFQNYVDHYILGNFIDVSLINPKYFYLYSSTIVIPLLYFYFINNKISLNEKKMTGIMLVIMFLSVGINYINYIWHGFIPPTGLNGRFTFMFILFLIYLSTKSIFNLKKFDSKYYFISFFLTYSLIFLYSIIKYPRLISVDTLISFYSVFFFLTCLSTMFYKDLSKKQIVLYVLCLIFLVVLYVFVNPVSLLSYLYSLFLIIIGVVLLRYINKKHNLLFRHYYIMGGILLFIVSIYSIVSNIGLLHMFTIFKILLSGLCILIFRFIYENKKLSIPLLFLILMELTMNGYYYLYRYSYKKLDVSYEKTIQMIKDKEESLFYRIENDYDLEPMNYPLLYDYHGIDYFMSTIKKDYYNFFTNMDVNNYLFGVKSVIYDGSYHLLSSLLNIKYYIETKDIETEYYNKIGQIDDYKIFQNEDSLELGYMVHSKIKDVEVGKNGLETINSIYKSMTNNDRDVLDEIDVTRIDQKTYSFHNDSNRDFYIVIKVKSYDIPYREVYLNIDGEEIANNKNSYLIKINNHYDFNKDLVIKLKSNKKQINNILGVYAYYYNDDVYKEDISILKENQLLITESSNNKITGTIHNTEDNILFISCLYNDKLNIYVDGKKQEKIKVLDTFIGTELKQGEHTITLMYEEDNIFYIFIPSILGIVLLSLYLNKEKIFKKSSFSGSVL